jgi:DNA-binding NarL/FixJ family response regulator
MSHYGPGKSCAESPTRIRTLLVEDNPDFLAYASGLLARKPLVEIIGQARDGFQAVRRATQTAPDLVLLDIGLPMMNGLEVLKRILSNVSKCRIIFLTQEASPEFIEAAFEGGASGYILKTRATEDLWPAILSACEGRFFLGSGLEQPTSLRSGIRRFAAS